MDGYKCSHDGCQRLGQTVPADPAPTDSGPEAAHAPRTLGLVRALEATLTATHQQGLADQVRALIPEVKALLGENADLNIENHHLNEALADAEQSAANHAEAHRQTQVKLTDARGLLPLDKQQVLDATEAFRQRLLTANIEYQQQRDDALRAANRAQAQVDALYALHPQRPIYEHHYNGNGTLIGMTKTGEYCQGCLPSPYVHCSGCDGDWDDDSDCAGVRNDSAYRWPCPSVAAMDAAIKATTEEDDQ